MTRGCSGCGGSKRSNPAPRNAPAQQSPMDSEMVLCKYIHPNRGSHAVLGAAQFDRPPQDLPTRRIAGTYRIDYGYRKGAGQEEFYVHKGDIELAPHLFMPIQEKVAVAVPVEEREPQRPPEPLVQPEPIEQLTIPRPHPDTLSGMVGEYTPPESLGVIADEFPPVVTVLEPEAEAPRPFDLQTLPGIGPASAELLRGNNINTKEDVLALGAEGLAEYRGIGPVKAEMIIESIEAMA